MDYEQHDLKSTRDANFDKNRTEGGVTLDSRRPGNSQHMPNGSIEVQDLIKTSVEGYQEIDTVMETRPPINEDTNNDITRNSASRHSTYPTSRKPAHSSPSLVKRKQGPTEDPPGLLGTIAGGIRALLTHGSDNPNQQLSNERNVHSEVSRNRDRGANGMSSQRDAHQKESHENEDSYRNHILRQGARNTELQEDFQRTLEAERRQWGQEINKYKRDRENLKRNHDIAVEQFRAQLRECESQLQEKGKELDAFICKQQEATLKHMAPARWLPDDERKVKEDLQSLKMNMRNWAKGVSVKDNSVFRTLREDDQAVLMQEVSKVALLEGGHLPKGLLSTEKCPMLLLKALLAHSVYTSFFRNPFFFLDERTIEATCDEELPHAAQVKDGSSKSTRRCMLNDIYQKVQKGTLIHTMLFYFN